MITQVSPAAAADKLIAEFDRAWQNGPVPELEAFVSRLPGPATPEGERLRRETLEELVRIDLEYRWRPGTPSEPRAGQALGQRPLLEQYVARCTDLQRGPQTPDLIAWEYRVRHCWGDRPGHAEYLKRFADQGPSLAEALKQIDADLALEFSRMEGNSPAVAAIDPAGSTVEAAADSGPRESALVPASLVGLLEVLRREEILSASQVTELGQSLQGQTVGPRDLARDLIRRSWLTPYQVNQMLQGRFSELRLGPYLLLERLGEGGASRVFKARHLLMNRVVALKVIHKELLTEPAVVSRFQREMGLVGQLNHPNIIRATDGGTIGALHALVMEYVEGIDLSRLVKQSGPLAVPLACECIRQAAEGLRYVHERALVHRDIKPSNLLVTLQMNDAAASSPRAASPAGKAPLPVAGRPLIKILDLGLARLCRNVADEPLLTNAHAANTLTPAGSVLIMGTPDYLAPEQALDFHGADIRADIYSLGCTFFYLLTGQPPFPGGSMAQKLRRHQQAEPPSVRQLRPEVPEETCRTLARMLAKRPEERFQTPAELIAALKKAVPSISGAPAKPRRRWAALAGGGILMLAALFILLFSSGRPGTATEEKHAAQLQSLRDRVSRRPAGGADRLLWQDLLDFRIRNAGTTEAQEAAALMAQVPSVLDSLPGRPQEIVATLACKDEKMHGLALSPDLRLAAMVTESNKERKLRLWDLPSRKELPAFEGIPTGAFAPAFSPDGRMLAVAGGKGTLKLWNCATGKPVGPFKARNGIRCLAFSPNGQTVAIGTNGGEVQLWDLPTMGEGPTFRDHNRTISSLSFSPDGRLLAAVCHDRPVAIWDLATGKLQAEVGLPAANGLTFSPSGRQALMSSGGKAQLWEAPAGKNVWALKTAVDGITPLAFTADGSKLLHLGPNRTIALTNVGSLAKSPPTYWTLPGKGGIDGFALASDMRHVALIDSGSININIVRLAAPPGK